MQYRIANTSTQLFVVCRIQSQWKPSKLNLSEAEAKILFFSDVWRREMFKMYF